MSTQTSAPYCLRHVPDGELHATLKGLVGRSNRLTAQLLAHLAEVDERGIYRERACASLYAYCVYELRMSEDEAGRRITAARTARRFPVLFEMVETAAIHLTGVILLAPHLTDENHARVLARARFRTKKEIQKLVREIAPLPAVPAMVEPLGPEPGPPPPRRATWSAFVAALAGPVRHIPPGNGPRQAPVAPDGTDDVGLGGKTVGAPVGVTASSDPAPARIEADVCGEHAPARVAEGATEPAAPPAPPRSPERPQRYKVQFTADQAYVDLLEAARDLLKHTIPDRDIAQVHERAMRALVEQLRKRKRRATDAPRPTRNARTRSRHVPAEVVRAVWDRDRAQCAFVDDRGRRCRETAGLELHHEQAYCRGGPATVDNISLLCRAHNQLEAERELGRGFVERKKQERGGGHEEASRPKGLADRWTPADALGRYRLRGAADRQRRSSAGTPTKARRSHCVERWLRSSSAALLEHRPMSRPIAMLRSRTCSLHHG